MRMTVRDVIAAVDTVAPPRLAVPGDPVGLHFGSPDARVRRVGVALDATLATVRVARRAKCQMLVTHHPRVYRPLPNLDESTPHGKLAAEIVRAGLAVYCAHTNFDAAPGGVNDVLARLAGIVRPQVVKPHGAEEYRKLTTFVPGTHLEAVRRALCAAGAGVIGEYFDCTFRVEGTGTFCGSERSRPYLGAVGRHEEAREFRLETRVPESRLAAAVAALRAAHPYEEPAYDAYRLAESVPFGCGRHGELERPATLKSFAARMRRGCASPSAQLLGDPARRVAQAAVWSGGGCPVALLPVLGVDAVALGEIGYHDLELLEQCGIGCVLLGHAHSEAVALPVLANGIRAALPQAEVAIYRDGTPTLRNL